MTSTRWWRCSTRTWALTIADDRITAIEVIAEPERLRDVEIAVPERH